jgi:hypothetical protein
MEKEEMMESKKYTKEVKKKENAGIYIPGVQIVNGAERGGEGEKKVEYKTVAVGQIPQKKKKKKI